jgi:DNA primase
MQPSGKAHEVEEISAPELRRSMAEIHIDTLAEEIARVGKLPASEPGKVERLYELSRKQQALLKAQKPGAKA